MIKIRIGIDIGKEGYFVIHNSENNSYETICMPKIGKIIDTKEVDSIIKTMLAGIDIFEGLDIYAVCEDLHAVFGSSAKATFEFGYAAGLIEMVLVSNNIPFTKVAPKKWQAEMWQGVPIMKKPSSTGKTLVNDTKGMSLVAAKRLFPGFNLCRTTRCKVADNNLVDALLMCLYAQRNF